MVQKCRLCRNNEVNHMEKNEVCILAKKQRRKKEGIATLVTLAVLAAIVLLLRLFPVYHLAQMAGVSSFYDGGELAMLAYRGSPGDRAAAQSVLRQADAAFGDCSHTAGENAQTYGLLARYATDSDRGAASTAHSLKLWSAHLGDTEGYLWVYYSSNAFDSQGNTVCGSSNVPSLWTVEKDDAGTWAVVDIKEHP